MKGCKREQKRTEKRSLENEFGWDEKKK